MRKKPIISLFLMASLVLTGCDTTNSSKDDAVKSLSEALEKFEKAESYEYSGSNKYEGVIYQNIDELTTVKIQKKEGAFYSLIKTENNNTRTNGYIDVTINKNIPDENYSMMIMASEYPDGLLLQHIMPNMPSVTTSDINYSKNSPMSNLQNSFYFKTEKMNDFFDVTLKEVDNNKVISLKVKDAKKFNEEQIKEAKKIDPNYDPYTLHDPYTMYDTKISKTDIKKYEAEFVLDQDNNLVSQKVQILIDYGDGLKYDSMYDMKYSNINTLTLDTNAIDALCEQVKDPYAVLSTRTFINPIN